MGYLFRVAASRPYVRFACCAALAFAAVLSRAEEPASADEAEDSWMVTMQGVPSGPLTMPSRAEAHATTNAAVAAVSPDNGIGIRLWEDYVGGLETGRPGMRLATFLAAEDGKPFVAWERDTSAPDARSWSIFTTYGTLVLGDAWEPVTTLPRPEPAYRSFFRACSIIP